MPASLEPPCFPSTTEIIGRLLTLPSRLRVRSSQIVARLFFEGLSSAGRLTPWARPEAHAVEVIRNIPYAGTPHAMHRLDVYRPKERSGPLPVLLYIHGGGFQLLSKDTHWVMALIFARAGYLVFNISYRLAPADPFPAALEDAAEAYAWVAKNAAEFGGDVSRLVLAGESAGANLACGLAIASAYRREEPYAQRAFDTGVVPRAVVLGCGILQVSDPLRFARRRKFPRWVQRLLVDISDAYLRGLQSGAELADPLVLLERAGPPERPLPAFFAFVGTRDPVLDDTRRLGRALERLGVVHDVRYYPGELHAFHALVMRKASRDCWREKFAFLDRALAPRGPEPRSSPLHGIGVA